MNQEDIQLLYEYDRWANRRVLEAVAALSSEDFTRDLGGSFASVRDAFVHIIAGEWTWLQYWKAPTPGPDFLAQLRIKRAAKFDPAKQWSLAEVKSSWEEVERSQIEFVAGLTGEQVEKLVPFRKTQVKLAHLMQHLANHSTYHRGQISLMMRQLKAAPVATDFHEFLVQGRDRAAAG
jgi:uncharacterized damage-inducible protein DinB